MDVELWMIWGVCVLCVVTMVATIIVYLPRHPNDTLRCESVGGIPITDDGVLRACLKPEAIIKVHSNEN